MSDRTLDIILTILGLLMSLMAFYQKKRMEASLTQQKKDAKDLLLSLAQTLVLSSMYEVRKLKKDGAWSDQDGGSIKRSVVSLLQRIGKAELELLFQGHTDVTLVGRYLDNLVEAQVQAFKDPTAVPPVPETTPPAPVVDQPAS